MYKYVYIYINMNTYIYIYIYMYIHISYVYIMWDTANFVLISVGVCFRYLNMGYMKTHNPNDKDGIIRVSSFSDKLILKV